jgi:hypothetical protein
MAGCNLPSKDHNQKISFGCGTTGLSCAATILTEKIRIKILERQTPMQQNFFSIKVKISFQETIEMSLYESLDHLVIGVIKEDDYLDWVETAKAENYFYDYFINTKEFKESDFIQNIKPQLISAVTELVVENFKQSGTYKLMILYDEELKRKIEEKKVI